MVSRKFTPMLRRIFVLIFSICFSFFLTAGRIENGFDALHRYDYFKAKKIFETTSKHHPAASGFGLAIIYSRHDNPFYDVTKAHAAILVSQWGWNGISEKEKIRIKKLGVDEIGINSLKKKN